MRYLKILIPTFVCIIGAKAFAYDFKKDGFYYNLDSYDLTAIVTYGESPYEGNIIIPNEVSYNGRTMSVKAVGESAFKDCVNLSSIQFCNSIKWIDDYSFSGCTKIKELTIPSSVGSIGRGAFYGCTNLEKLIIEDGESLLGCGVNGRQSPSAVFDCKLKYLYIGRDMGYPDWGYTYNLDNTNLSTIVIGSGKTIVSGFKGAKITEITIPSNVTYIKAEAFYDCEYLKSVYFEDSDTPLKWTLSSGTVFRNCPIKNAYIGREITPYEEYISNGSEGLFDRTSVEEITVSNNVTMLCGFNYCENIKEIVIPSSVRKMGGFKGCNSLKTIKCLNTTPPKLESYYTLAENSTYLDGILYVPVGSIDNYKNDEKWGKFFNILEISNDNPSTRPRCERPTISYNKGKISFYSTDGSICHSTITDSDVSSYTANEIQLSVTYNIRVYATKPGYDDSETATATLCWIDVEPKTEGITNNVANVRAVAVMVQNSEGQLTISGTDDGTQINVYNINGIQAGSAISHSGSAIINTNLHTGSVAIVKIGERSIKVLLK